MRRLASTTPLQITLTIVLLVGSVWARWSMSWAASASTPPSPRLLGAAASLPPMHRMPSPDEAIAPIAALLTRSAAAPCDDAVVQLVVRDADTKMPIPARARVLGWLATPTPDLGPVHAAAGALDTVVTASGRARIALGTGRYRLRISRGPEWSIAERTIVLGAREQRKLAVELRHVVDPGVFLAADFHLHAAPSRDSDVTLADRVASLAAEGIAFAVPTDHNHVVDYAPVARELGLASELATVPGVEVTTWAPDFGHFNAFPWTFDRDDARGGAPPFLHRAPGELFAALHAHSEDTVVQVNHPRLEGGIGYLERIGFDPRGADAPLDDSVGFDAIEVWNGYDLDRPAQLARNLDDWMALLARGARVTATGNSDSHRIHGQWAGYPRTYVRATHQAAEADPVSVVRALRRGEAFVTSGPVLDVAVEGAYPGERATLAADAFTVHVEARAPDWMDLSVLEIYVDGDLAHVERVSTKRLGSAGSGAHQVVRDVELVARKNAAVGRASFVVVLVRGEEPMEALLAPRDAMPLAFTNPIWLD